MKQEEPEKLSTLTSTVWLAGEFCSHKIYKIHSDNELEVCLALLVNRKLDRYIDGILNMVVTTSNHDIPIDDEAFGKLKKLYNDRYLSDTEKTDEVLNCIPIDVLGKMVRFYRNKVHQRMYSRLSDIECIE
jgi:hypothetical protein